MSKDKKARRAALHEFLLAVPAALDRAGSAFGRLVVLAALALVLIAWRLFVIHPGPPPPPPPGGLGNNPAGALYVRDLGRLPDGRHTFDLVYTLVLRNAATRPFVIEAASDQLDLGQFTGAGDVVRLDHPGTTGGALAWHTALSSVQAMGLAGTYPPGAWKAGTAHYRLNARPDQFAALAIAYRFAGHDPVPSADRHGEEVQLGAVLRAHCPLGIKVTQSEVRSLCAPSSPL